jgi:predicted Na+-dependent transporter
MRSSLIVVAVVIAYALFFLAAGHMDSALGKLLLTGCVIILFFVMGVSSSFSRPNQVGSG